MSSSQAAGGYALSAYTYDVHVFWQLSLLSKKGPEAASGGLYTYKTD